MRTRLLAIALFTLTAGLVFGFPSAEKTTPQLPHTPNPPVAASNQERPKIDAVFVLDTTGSMAGLIDAAKENIWSIASTMASAQPTPELRIGLVAYRDRGDEYVTRVIDLSGDLDSMYATLMDFAAGGGGDHPESVNQALHDAVHRISWSQDASAYKTLFLIGDAPPQMYADEPHYPEILKAAAARGILINSIQAGGHTDTRKTWEQIAQLGQGEYFQVGQHGSRVAVATPFDDRIAALSKDLDATRLYFGDAREQDEMAAKQAATEKLHAAASSESRAKRAAFNASEAGRDNLLGKNELVDAISEGRISLDDIATEHLPETLREMEPQEQQKLIADKAARRAELSEEIARLGAERQAHIEAELKDDEGKEDSLDYQVFRTVQAQAAGKGLRYEAAPKH